VNSEIYFFLFDKKNAKPQNTKPLNPNPQPKTSNPLPMKIFISGASGLVGSNCLSHFLAQGADAIGTYFSYPLPGIYPFNTLQINDENNFDVTKFAPNIIVHCGAMTHVDACETAEQESFDKTVQSTLNLIQLSEQLNAKLVYLSTDYIFDGLAGPYAEDAPTNPLSIYAKHKLEAEQAVILANKNNLILRITNVYGKEARNKNFVSRIIEQCQNKQTLTLNLPQDQYATPVNALDVARAMYILLQDNQCGIFHIASTDWMNRVELANTVLKYFPDANYTMQGILTKDLNQPAARPLLGGLLKTKFSNLYPDFMFSNVDDFVREQTSQTSQL
jgi:dTDP-4-dehydrorhamnose reductase